MQGDQSEREEPLDEGEKSRGARNEPAQVGEAGGAGGGGGDAADGGCSEAGGADEGGGDAANGGGEGGAGGTRTVSLDITAARTVDLDARAARTVNLEDQARRVGLDAGTFLQRSGVTLFIVVLTVVLLVLIALFVNLFNELAQVPSAPGGDALKAAFQRGDTVQTLRLAAHYRAVSDVVVAQRDSAWAHFIQGVKELVVGVFLPLLSGILGYIFGTRSEAASNATGE